MADRAQIAQKAMRRAGLRCTNQRIRILRCLAQLPRHFGAEELLEALNAGDAKPAVSRATLYRLLSQLERLGLLRKVLLSEGHSHYELALTQEHHCHLVCSRCGRVVEIRSPALDRTVKRLCDDQGFDVREAEVEITIVCDRCQAQGSDENDSTKSHSPGKSRSSRRGR